MPWRNWGIPVSGRKPRNHEQSSWIAMRAPSTRPSKGTDAIAKQRGIDQVGKKDLQWFRRILCQFFRPRELFEAAEQVSSKQVGEPPVMPNESRCDSDQKIPVPPVLVTAASHAVGRVQVPAASQNVCPASAQTINDRAIQMTEAGLSHSMHAAQEAVRNRDPILGRSKPSRL